MASSDQCWISIKLKYPDVNLEHTLFVHPLSGDEVEVCNLPLAENEQILKELLEGIFSAFGRLESVTLEEEDLAKVKYLSEKGVPRIISKKTKHDAELPPATAGTFGFDRYYSMYAKLHPPLETLEHVSSEFINEFEKREAEIRRNSGVNRRHVAKFTRAETEEIMRRHRERVKKMQSTDFYAFQTREQMNLAKALISDNPTEPRHKKKSKPSKPSKP